MNSIIGRYSLKTWIFCILGALVIAFGGAAQFFHVSDIVSRLAALTIVAILFHTEPDLKPSKVALFFFLLVLGLGAIQLVPLPYEWWRLFPGMDEPADVLAAVSATDAMRTISIAPTRTFDSLLFMIVPLAGYALGLSSDARVVRALLITMLIIASVSAVAGWAQLLLSQYADLYPYRITNEGSAVGLFANRNHQATFLVLAIVFTMRLALEERASIPFCVLAMAFVALLCASVLATQSRAGALLLAGIFIFLVCNIKGYFPCIFEKIQPRFSIAPVIGVLSVGLITFLFFGGPVAGRLIQSFDEPLNRMDGILIATSAIGDFWLTGSGLGTFEWLAPSYEDASSLTFVYWNHAHNDWLQLIAEGGVGAYVIIGLAAYFAISRFRAYHSEKKDLGDRSSRLLPFFVCILVVAVHSLADYPLRTAAISFVVFWCVGLIDAWYGARRRRVWTSNVRRMASTSASTAR